MADAIVGGDFETAGLWEELRSIRVSDFAHGGTWSERMRSIRTFGTPFEATILQVSAALTGEEFTPHFWVRADADAISGGCELYLVGSSSPAGPIDIFYDFVPINSLVAGDWTEVTFASITLPCDTPYLGLWLTGPTSGTQGIVRVDDFTISNQAGANMAVMGFELPLRAMLATLQANLNTELTHIGNEANDSLTPPAVEKWYCWKVTQQFVDRAICEVYELGGTTLKDWDSQVSAWVVGSRLPLRMEHSMVVAVTFANRGLTIGGAARTLKMSEMKVLAIRYATAVLRVVRNTPTLGQAAIVYAEPGEAVITYGEDNPPDAAPGSLRVEVPFRVSVSESSSGETTLNGGVRPSANLEG